MVAQLLEQADGRRTVLLVWDDSGLPVVAEELAGFDKPLAPQVPASAAAAGPKAKPAAARARRHSKPLGAPRPKPSATIFSRPSTGSSSRPTACLLRPRCCALANKPEQQIIEAVYAERAKVDTWSKSSRQQVKDSVLARFDHELVGP